MNLLGSITGTFWFLVALVYAAIVALNWHGTLEAYRIKRRARGAASVITGRPLSRLVEAWAKAWVVKEFVVDLFWPITLVWILLDDEKES